MPTIGEKIRELRIQRGMTQTDLGAELVTPSMISQIEADRAKASYSLITSIANRLGVPVEHFLSDTDDLLAQTTRLGIASYYTRANQPLKALDILEHMQAPEPFGHTYHEYLLLQAKCYRLLERYSEATTHLESLRAQSYRSQDKLLQFQVCQESGYIEYGLQNHDGAMHEWRKAIHLGELLKDHAPLSYGRLNCELTDMFLCMNDILRKQNLDEEAGGFLQQATDLNQSSGRLKSLAEGMINDACNLLHTDAAQARLFAERAISLVESEHIVEQYIRLQLHHSEHSQPVMDPWNQVALATVSMNPLMFVELECLRIEKYFTSTESEAANRRILRCLEILDDYRSDSSTIDEEHFLELECQLYIYKARVQHMNGNLEEATQLLEVLCSRLQPDLHRDIIKRVCGYLMLWYGEQNNLEQVFRFSERAEQLMAQQQQQLYTHDL